MYESDTPPASPVPTSSPETAVPLPAPIEPQEWHFRQSIDYSVMAPPFTGGDNNAETPANVQGLTFATNENSYLIGCMAAMMASVMPVVVVLPK